MIDVEYEYYKKNYKVIYKEHPNKFVIIKDKKIVGVYKTIWEAYNYGVAKYWLGNFLLEHSTGQLEVCNFNTRVIFN